MSKQYSAGSLVNIYDRDWVVQPNPDPDLILLKPLGGSEEESIAILKSLGFPDDKIHDASFPYPSFNDIADFASAKLLYEATRLLFRSGAGPFRSFGKLSFRPRSYQLVPLIMALKQDVIRLLIADDVGIGKTIEAGLIVRELIDRGELKNFAVICLPHLCEQWQQELKSKFDIDAVIVRSGNISSLEKGLPPHTSIFRHYPFQIISIDYAKTETNRNWFLQECPDFIIVDEAHTCANTTGQQNSQQQQRYALLRKLSEKEERSIVMLTATPHSGKPLEFQSVVGLLNKEFNAGSFDLSDPAIIKRLVPHFIQRRRVDIRKFLNEETPFSDRIPGEVEYDLSNEYAILFDKIILFARDIVKEGDAKQLKQRLKYWAALGLLRGVMSSPHAGIEMLRNRAFKKNEQEALELFGDDELFDQLGKDRDTLPTALLEYSEFSDSEVRKLKSLAVELQSLVGIEKDRKIRKTVQLIKEWLQEGLHPVVFCKYIETAKYVGKILQEEFKKEFPGLEMETITGETHDEERKEKILALTEKQSSSRLLVCTDCLSEGINLQEGFNALLHYDLPWNPNRLEQREGRIDRFGQSTKLVKTFMLYGKDNPIDGVVLRVLLRKAIDIKKQIGISVPFPEDSKSVMEAVGAAVLLNPALAKPASQLEIGFKDPVADEEIKVGRSYEEARKKAEDLRNRFAQSRILEDLDIEADLKQTDEALGNPDAVEQFVKYAIHFLGGHCQSWKQGYKLQPGNLPNIIKAFFPSKGQMTISFQSPTPDGYHYIGRNHPLVENLAQIIISGAFDHIPPQVARASLFRSEMVKSKTVLTILRVRNVMRRKKGVGELIAEELVCWGYKNQVMEENLLTHEEVKNLLNTMTVSQDLNANQRESFLKQEIEAIQQHESILNNLVKEHAHAMVKLHTKYRKALGTEDYEVGTIVPPDVLGVYIIYPII